MITFILHELNYFFKLFFCPSFFFFHSSIQLSICLLCLLYLWQKSPSGWMSQSACQWPALTTKRLSASSPRAPQVVVSPSMRLRSSIMARRPRRRAAGQTEAHFCKPLTFLFSVPFALMSKNSIFLRRIYIFYCVYLTSMLV